MTTIKNLFAGLLLFVSLSSCNDMLLEQPYGVYSDNNFFTSEADALNALLYAYDPISNIEYGARFLFNLTDIPTNQYRSYNKGLETGLFEWDVNPNTEEILYFFKYCYLGITRANSVLENVGSMTNISDEARRQFLGEAHFLRAFHYFMLVRIYGEVPYHVKVVQGVQEAKVRFGSLPELYDLIIADLNEAITLMNVAKQQGRADKVAAQALLAKVYLTLASSKETGAPGYEWVSDVDNLFANAAETAGQVLRGQNTYGLDPNLLNVYDVEHQADGKEHIFITSMTREGSGFEGNYSQLPQIFTIGLPNVYVANTLTGDGGVIPVIQPGQQGWQYYRVDNEFYHSFDDNDLRKRLMVTTIYNADGSVLANWSEDNLTSSNPTLFAFFYPFSRKYTDPHSNSHRTSANLYLIRFAEVALTYAEAAGPTDEGYYWINQVRERAGLDELPPGLSAQQFKEAVWDELTFELAFEGHGLFELRRTNRVLEEVTNKPVNEEYAYFFPVPQRELDLNPKN
ncbi:carbohydrate-binding protein [Parapedobacter defluvii]|uniref:Carbohydrate-binding protein n=1 Tax=Parapedobacter defluvii TaxID=2045106 RepID=A0ABQ1MY09_9SPHI|nr:RagB/SusD family nutrient uptake outer membrane protein [Parapedobacter defluvii]GGC47197.1 carbohydrate-binding protein [Parapedobacter defluvii]